MVTKAMNSGEDGGGDEEGVMDKLDNIKDMIEQKCVPYMEIVENTDTSIRGKVSRSTPMTTLSKLLPKPFVFL